MTPRTINSIGLVIASMSLAMPLIIGMIEISSRLYAHGIVAVVACFAIWMLASAYLVIHFLGRTQEEIQD